MSGYYRVKVRARHVGRGAQTGPFLARGKFAGLHASQLH